MTKTKLFAFLSMILLSFAVLSCSKGDDDGGDAPGGDLKAGQVQIKGYADDYSKKITFDATAKKLTIDWGDGTIDDIVPNGKGGKFSHEYENSINFQTISINTEDLTEIGHFGYDGDIRELRFGNCPKLKEISIGYYYSAYDSDVPNLTIFEINRAESLTHLYINDTDLTELNLNGCTNLTKLICYENDLIASLNVSKCTRLESLECYYNQLTSLDVSGCTNLTELWCYSNQLTSLDVSKCTKLKNLSCFYNQLSATALNSLFTGLPVRTAADNAWIDCMSNPGSGSCNTSIAENKGWQVSN